MTDEYKTDEEQIEQLKAWWSKHGNTVATVALVAAGTWFGVSWWNDKQLQEQQSASALFDGVVESSLVQDTSDAQKAKAAELSESIKNDYGSSVYALFSALFNAKSAVDSGNLNGAETELQWVLDQENVPAEIKWIAQLRLARVKHALGQSEQALTLLNKDENVSAFAAAYAEARGDIYYSMGDLKKAKSAYQQSELLAGEQGINRPDLRMKLDSLVSVELEPSDAAISDEPDADNDVQAASGSALNNEKEGDA